MVYNMTVMKEEQKKKLQKVLEEMKDAHGLIGFWMKGSPIDATLEGWITTIEEILKEEVKQLDLPTLPGAADDKTGEMAIE